MNKQEFVKTSEGTLLPIGEHVSAYAKLGAGETIVLPIKLSRNPKFHRLAFSWFNSIYSNQEIWDSLEQMRYQLTIQAGFIKHQSVDLMSKMFKCTNCGHEQMVEYERHIVQPKSLNFESMDEDEFHEVTGGIDRVLQERHGINIEMGFH